MSEQTDNYIGPVIDVDDYKVNDGKTVHLLFRFESYSFSPEQAISLGERLQNAGEEAMELKED